MKFRSILVSHHPLTVCLRDDWLKSTSLKMALIQSVESPFQRNNWLISKVGYYLWLYEFLSYKVLVIFLNSKVKPSKFEMQVTQPCSDSKPLWILLIFGFISPGLTCIFKILRYDVCFFFFSHLNLSPVYIHVNVCTRLCQLLHNVTWTKREDFFI